MNYVCAELQRSRPPLRRGDPQRPKLLELFGGGLKIKLK